MILNVAKETIQQFCLLLLVTTMSLLVGTVFASILMKGKIDSICCQFLSVSILDVMVKLIVR